MPRRRTPTLPLPTVWFAAVVAATGLALLAWSGDSWDVLLVIEGALVALFAVDALLAPSPRAIEVVRDVPSTLRAGDGGAMSWRIENRAARPAVVVMNDALWPSLGARRRGGPMRLGPGERVLLRSELAPSRRGRFPLEAVTVRVTGPMRLAYRQTTRSVPDVVRVMPAYPSRAAVRRRVRSPRVADLGVRSVRRAGGGTEFDQLREFRPDDEFRRIDWPSTVRLQRPIVKQYRAERNQNVVVLLDNGRMMAGTLGDVARVEHAMDAALGLTEAAVELGDRVGLVCFDRQVRALVTSSSSSAQMARVAEAMYLLEPDLAESAYGAAFSYAASRFRRRSLYVVLTDLSEATVAQALLQALRILVRTHVVVVAAVRDPEVDAWARDAGHQWPSEVFRTAAAIGAGHQRERTAAMLRAAGVIVVDAVPGQLALDVVDTYIDLKASGRL